MDIESEQFDSNSVITSIDEHENTPLACNHQMKLALEEGEDNINSGDDDDDDDDICPLFMDGLPKNFASNPHLAAIASLLNDDNDDDDNDYSQEEDEEQQKLNLDFKNDGSDSALLTVANTTTSSMYERCATGDRSCRYNYTSLSSSRNRRRRQQCTSPYPQKLSSQKSNSNVMSSSIKRPKTKAVSVGETTLFLNMWQL
mmetsp:Transcript_8184/g.9528  ORF Transcript_8184/g.9528 Transcript_8184/m.9528 type:complete len:200 (+) Transcript_8184:58-657(+)